MIAATRKGIALIAASLVEQHTFEHILSQDDGRGTNFTGRTGEITSVYDYDRSRTINGVVRDGRSTLFDFGSHHAITLRIDGTTFGGHDSLSETDFEGHVEGRTVRIYDHETNREHTFTVR